MEISVQLAQILPNSASAKRRRGWVFIESSFNKEYRCSDARDGMFGEEVGAEIGGRLRLTFKNGGVSCVIPTRRIPPIFHAPSHRIHSACHGAELVLRNPLVARSVNLIARLWLHGLAQCVQSFVVRSLVGNLLSNGVVVGPPAVGNHIVAAVKGNCTHE